MKQKNLATYRQTDFKGSEEELEALLLWALAKKQPTNVAVVAGVDMVAAAMAGEVVVTVRRDGLRVAELHLPVTEEEISIYEWAECAVDARDRAMVRPGHYFYLHIHGTDIPRPNRKSTAQRWRRRHE